MKRLNCIGILVFLSAVSGAQAQRGTLVFPPPPLPAPKPVPPPLWVDTNFQPPEWSAAKTVAPASGEVLVYDQKQYGGHAPLIAPEQAQGIIDRFKAAYPKLGSPRFLFYVNRELSAATPAATLADKQTVRDVERLFGRPLRQAGASLADQKVAAELLAGKPVTEVVGTTDTPQSRKDHEALLKIADVVIEILISSKTVTVPTIADAQTIALPDIQATAIRLSDSKILGQATSSDVTNRVPPPSLSGYGVPEITEATALALMEDLTTAP